MSMFTSAPDRAQARRQWIQKIAAATLATALSGLSQADALAQPAASLASATVGTHQNAPTQFVEVKGQRYAYRKLGPAGGVPLIMLQHFRGNLDNWDPTVTDGLAQRRPVYLFDNAGVGASSGETPDTVEAMADHVAAFAAALNVAQADLLGFSLGGMVAQETALRHPHLVRKLVLAGTGPRGGVSGSDAKAIGIATREQVAGLDGVLYLFFDQNALSQQAGREFWERRQQRTADLDSPTSRQTMQAQIAALTAWGKPGDGAYTDLARIAKPTLVVNGARDVMVPTPNSFILQQKIPDAKLVLYPNSGHGAIFQHARDFVSQANSFLD